jgi:hypothetical protein
MTQTIKSIPSTLVQPINCALSEIFKAMRGANKQNVKPYLEFFIFPLLVLSVKPWDEMRNLSARKRRKIQLEYNVDQLKRWNSEKDSFINQFITNNLNSANSFTPNSSTKPPNSHLGNLKRAEKLVRFDGQYGKAIKALQSNGVAPFSPESYSILCDKHPSSSPPAVVPDFSGGALRTSGQKILLALQSFPKGSGNSRSGWRVLHFIELFSHQSFVEFFTEFINRFLANKVPSELASILVSGTLVPILKKDGGIRPIVVGEVFRRLISKLCVSAVSNVATEYLEPLQLGVGVQGGCEAVLHSFNRSIRNPNLDQDSILSLVDFKNAFNEVNRNYFLHEVQLKYPKIYPWVVFCYSIEAPLFFENHIISASTGVQQGDPLGPLLFSLVLHPLLLEIKSKFSLQVGAILDDVTFLGSPCNTLLALNYIGVEGPKRGLFLSTKTTLWSPFHKNIPQNLIVWSPVYDNQFSLTISKEKGVSLLGGGVSRDSSFLSEVADKRLRKWCESISLMMDIKDPFIQLQLLRSCLGAPKLNYLLRTTPPNLIYPSILKMELFLKETLKSIITGNGPHFGDFQFKLATLPISKSGLGIYNPRDICVFSYISSLSQTIDLQNRVIDNPNIGLPLEYNYFRQYFIDMFNNHEEIGLPQCTQKNLATIYFKVKRLSVINDVFISMQDKELLQKRFIAILESFRQPHASAYLFALPNYSLNQVMSPKEFRANMALRLLIPKFSGELTCNKPNCAAKMDSYGYHAINCRGSHFARHEGVVNALYLLAMEACLHPKKNAQVQCLGTSWRGSSSSLVAFRPADILMQWDEVIRKCCVDVTVVSPIKSFMTENFLVGKEAKRAEDDKMAKHKDACCFSGFEFMPFAVDVFGVYAPAAKKLLKTIVSILEGSKGYPKYLASNIVFSRISFAIHRGVAKQMVDRMEAGTFF